MQPLNKSILTSAVSGAMAIAGVFSLVPGPSEAAYPIIAPAAPAAKAEPIKGSSIAFIHAIAKPQSQSGESIWLAHSTDSLSIALMKAGLDETVPRGMVEVAKRFLSENGFDGAVLNVTTLHDPDEDKNVVSAVFSVPGSLERVMEFDLLLTREFVRRFPQIPYEFSVALENV